MPDEDTTLAAKILLLRASNKSKAKSWLTASLGANADTKDRNSQQADNTNTNTNTNISPKEPEEEDTLIAIQGDDELSGIGAPRKSDAIDDPSNRHLMSANDALRRKLLSRDAYGKYQRGGREGLSASKAMPMSRGVRRGNDESKDEDVDEGKGRSGVVGKKRTPTVGGSALQVSDQSSEPQQHVSNGASKPKKRPGSYLDQILAERGKKKKKSKSTGDQD